MMNPKLSYVALLAVVVVAQASPAKNVFPKFDHDVAINGPSDIDSDIVYPDSETERDGNGIIVDEKFDIIHKYLKTPRTARLQSFPPINEFPNNNSNQRQSGFSEAKPFPTFEIVVQNTDGLIPETTTVSSDTGTTVTRATTKMPTDPMGLAGIISSAIHRVNNENANNLNILADASLSLAQAFLRFKNLLVATKVKLGMSIPLFGYNFYKNLEKTNEQT